MTTTIKIRTTAVKALLLLSVMNLAFACSETNTNTPKADATTPTMATPEKAPDTISIGGTTESIDLFAKYNTIKPDDYCWQTNKVLELHTQPSASSKVEGKHFAGEVLKVLGTKTVNNQLWVNVTYKLQVKTGYEDQFADGRVTPSGLPTGWIGGTETPTVNCK